MKFNALLEWLQSQLSGSAPKAKQRKTNSKTDTANAIKAEKALKGERERDGMGTSTEDAPPAEPEPIAEEVVMKDTMGGAPADPVPEDEADTSSAADARKTASHEEL
jgi:hypothetical protein